MATAKPKNSKSKTSKKIASNSTEQLSLIDGIKLEWGRITWPTWPQIWGNTIVVIVMVALVSLGMWAVDNVFKAGICGVTGNYTASTFGRCFNGKK